MYFLLDYFASPHPERLRCTARGVSAEVVRQRRLDPSDRRWQPSRLLHVVDAKGLDVLIQSEGGVDTGPELVCGP